MPSQPVQKSKNSFYCKVYLGKDSDGKKHSKRISGKTAKQAWQKACAYEHDLQQEKRSDADPVHYMTLHQAMQKYIDIKRETLQLSTISSYERIMRTDFLDIQDCILNELTNDKIQKSLNASASRPSKNANCKNGLSHKSLKNASDFLRAVLKRYYPDFNYRIDIPKGNPNEHERILLEPEVIIKAVKGTNIELAVWLGMLSLRLSEILGLRKIDCDLDAGVATIRQTVADDGNIDERVVRPYGKTAKSLRSIALPPYVISLIQALPPKQEYLVPVRKQTLQKRLDALLKREGLEHMGFHDLRHLHASITQSLEIDDKIREEIGGWSNPTVMNGVYTSIMPKDRKAADQKISDYFEAALRNATMDSKVS